MAKKVQVVDSEEAAIQREYKRRLRAALYRWLTLVVLLFAGTPLAINAGLPSDSAGILAMLLVMCMMFSYLFLRCPRCGESQYKRRDKTCWNCRARLLP